MIGNDDMVMDRVNYFRIFDKCLKSCQINN